MILWLIASSVMLLPQFRPEAGVYAAMRELRYHGTLGSTMTVREETVLMPTIAGSRAEWLRQFDDIPVALREAVSQPAPTRAPKLDPAWFPAGTRFVSERAIQALFAGGPENWASFKQKHGTEGWLALSEVLLTKDGLHALVYYQAHCGGLCAESGYAWLRRDAITSRWSIRKRIVSSMA